MSEPTGTRGLAPSADVTAAVSNLLGVARVALRNDPESTRSYLVRAISMLDSQGCPSKRVSIRKQGGLATWQVRRVTAYVDEHIGMTIRTGELARVVNLSVSHFSRAFKRSFGETATCYLARRRVDLARELMLTTSAPLSQIALDCGLCDQSHLTRVFRRYVGTSPRHWRRQHSAGPGGSYARAASTANRQDVHAHAWHQ